MELTELSFIYLFVFSIQIKYSIKFKISTLLLPKKRHNISKTNRFPNFALNKLNLLSHGGY